MPPREVCELTIRLWGVFEGVGCGNGAAELTAVALAFIGLGAFRLWLKMRVPIVRNSNSDGEQK
jgi:hypothetical protein